MSLPLHVVSAETFGTWLNGRSEAEQNQLRVRQFAGAPSTGAWLLDADGSLSGAVLGVADFLDPFAYSHALTLLPEGTEWSLASSLDGAQTQALVLGWKLGAYRFLKYRPTVKWNPARLDVAASAATQYAYEATALVRDLIHTPTQDMGPADLQNVIETLGLTHQAEVRAVVGDELLAENFPAIHAVGRASHRAPRLIELNWTGPGATKRLVIVGKGVCFDTGGLDLKPADGMRNMKKDMGGSAHAIGLAKWIMDAQLPVQLTLLVGAVENAIGPDAFRPGEVINTRAGFTVEIDNTDAEGRVVLCDALTYASEMSPDLIMDFATLTGAARIALGPDLPALFTNEDALAAAWSAAGLETRDPVWRMPLHQPYWRYLPSGIADFANAGPSKMAGSVTAAIYLQRFVGAGIPWTHLDVYSWNDADRPGRPAGGEAQALRSAFRLVEQRYS